MLTCAAVALGALAHAVLYLTLGWGATFYLNDPAALFFPVACMVSAAISIRLQWRMASPFDAKAVRTKLVALTALGGLLCGFVFLLGNPIFASDDVVFVWYAGAMVAALGPIIGSWTIYRERLSDEAFWRVER